MKKLFKNKILVAFLLSFILGAFIVVPNMIIGKGVYTLISDYNLQQVPFGQLMNYSIKEGSFLWSWYNELGSNFIGTFSFYNLFSPFSLIGYLFPADFFPYLNGFLMILKYGVAGLTSYLFLQRYVKNKDYAIIGSLLYTFSGFQLTNILFHFSDAICLFPLLLYTLDNYIYEGKKVWFALVVALLSFTNWFFMIGQIVFLVIYFLIKVVTKEYKITWKLFFGIIFEGLLGLLLAAVVLIPSCLFVMNNPRIETEWSLISMLKYWELGPYVEIIKAFLFPPEAMSYRAFVYESFHCSVDAYLPFVGMTLVLACFIKNYKKWYSILLMCCGIMTLVPILNSSFFMFTTSYYARWFYMIVLIMSLMSIKCFEDKKINIKHGVIFNLLLFIVFGLIVWVYTKKINNSNIIFDNFYFWSMIIISIVSVFILYFVFKCNNKKRVLFTILSIGLYVIGWGNYITYIYRWKSIDEDVEYKNYLDVSKYIDVSGSRTNGTSSCMYNLGATGKFHNIKGFNSNINGSNFEFYHGIDYDRTVSTIIEDDRLNDYLGVEYIISCGGDELDNYQVTEENGPYKLYYNTGYKDFGFSVNKYISVEEYETLDTDEKINKLGNYVILNKEQINKYRDLFDDEVTYSSNKFKFLKNGFSSKINSNGDTLAIYTIPYDEGWKATNNGSEIEIEKVDNGMMAIKVFEGDNDIVFSYVTPGLRSGFVVSLMSLGVLGCYIYLNKRKVI